MTGSSDNASPDPGARRPSWGPRSGRRHSGQARRPKGPPNALLRRRGPAPDIDWGSDGGSVHDIHSPHFSDSSSFSQAGFSFDGGDPSGDEPCSPESPPPRSPLSPRDHEPWRNRKESRERACSLDMVNEEKGHGSFASPCASLDDKPEVGSDVGSSRNGSVVAHFPPALLPGAPAPDGPDVFGQIFEAPVRKTGDDAAALVSPRSASSRGSLGTSLGNPSPPPSRGERRPRRSETALRDEATAERKASFSVELDGRLASDIKDAELSIEQHLGDSEGDPLVAETISRHVASSLATADARVSRISDPLITTDMVRRKSSGVVEPPDNLDWPESAFR